MPKKPHATEADIMAFMEAVYPSTAHLAMAAFTEKKVLADATATISSLKAEIDRLESVLTALREQMEKGMVVTLYCYEAADGRRIMIKAHHALLEMKIHESRRAVIILLEEGEKK